MSPDSSDRLHISLAAVRSGSAGRGFKALPWPASCVSAPFPRSPRSRRTSPSPALPCRVATVASVGAVAGFGTGARPEYLPHSVDFRDSARFLGRHGRHQHRRGQRERALKTALTGGALAFALTEAIGIAAAIWPEQWLKLFSAEPDMIEASSAYLRIVGPTYGFFGLGMLLYFASQGRGGCSGRSPAGFLRYRHRARLGIDRAETDRPAQWALSQQSHWR